MTFTQEFIDEALKEHHKWVDKVRYVSSEFDIPLTWRQVLISNESEILNLLNHLRVEIHDESSMYSELRYELEYTKDMITKMFLHAQIICTLIDVLRKRVLSDVLITAIRETIGIVANEIYVASSDIITRLLRWKEISV
jgi:hypothetical protein